MKKTYDAPVVGKILIADFYKRLLLPVTDLLRKEGYECIYTNEEETIVEILKYIEFDLLIINKNGISKSTNPKEFLRTTQRSPITLSTRNSIYNKQIHSPIPLIITCIGNPIDHQELLKQVRYYKKSN